MGSDGTHKPGSLHYVGHALDLRTHNIANVASVIEEFKTRLGPEFDAFIEDAGTPNEHCHVEWQPKTPR